MSVTNAVPNTQEANVTFKPVLEGLLIKEREAQLMLQALHSQPITPVKVDRLENFLKLGYDSVLRQYLIDGFCFGFRINFVGERAVSECCNLKSALTLPDITATKIRKECDAGRLVRQITTPPFKNFHTSPLGLVPKKEPNEYHLIHHLSYPEGSSVNYFIPDSCATVRNASIRDASKSIKCIGPGCFMAKTDIKSAFRIIPIHPADYSLLGMKWDHLYYFDRCLAMGLRSSCAIFEAFSTSLEWISIHLLRACSVLHIPDDFLFIAPTEDQCKRDLDNFVSLCNHLGVPLAPGKTVGPGTALQFAGIMLDSVRMEARLPEEKLQNCHNLLTDFLSRRSVRLKELQSLIGLLNFTCLVVVPGRAFLQKFLFLFIPYQTSLSHSYFQRCKTRSHYVASISNRI